MNVAVRVLAKAKATRISGEKPPVDVEIYLEVTDAERGEGAIGAIEKGLAGANRAIERVLSERPY